MKELTTSDGIPFIPQNTIDAIRWMMEMAYLHAWGPKGNADLRDEYQLKSKLLRNTIGELEYFGNNYFTWKD